MSYWLLPGSGIPISATTVQRMTNDEKATDETQKRMAHYEEGLRSIFEAPTADLTRSLRDVHPSYVIDPENKDPTFYNDFTRVMDDAQLKHADKESTKDTEVTSDPYVGMEMAISKGVEGKLVHATVRKHVRDDDGMPFGMAHSNPLLDSWKHEIEYVDGHVEELAASLIAENLITLTLETSLRIRKISPKYIVSQKSCCPVPRGRRISTTAFVEASHATNKVRRRSHQPSSHHIGIARDNTP